jgi:predicted DsbA family dithiol-disulfide isomerase
MKIEIWSDVMCPFCYIGKRKFETALEKFEHKDKVEITWKSFQLSPDMEYKEGETLSSYLAKHKGWSLEQAQSANQHVANMAKESGLDFNFHNAIPANTFNAHRLIHLASKFNLQDEAEELLFSSYFTQGKNVGDTATLIALGKQIGIPESELSSLFEGDQYAQDVEKDIREAQQIGVRGVPFFVFDRKYAVSGAQPSEVFLETLEKVMAETPLTKLAGKNSDSCEIDGEC